MSIRVAFDATQLPRRGAGTHTYITHLVKALAGLSDREFELLVLAKDCDTELLHACAPGIEVVAVRLPTRPLRLVWEQSLLPLVLARRGVRLVHSPHYTLPLWGDLVRVVTFHDLTYLLMPERHSRSRRWFFRWMIPKAARLADHILCDSNQTREDLHELLPDVPASKTSVVSLGIDQSFFHGLPPAMVQRVRDRYNLPLEYVLHVGTIEPRKNVETALRAVEILLQSGVQVALVLVGQFGWASEDLMATLLRSPVCHVLGHVPFEDLRALYAGAKALVVPSHYEGFGLPVVEGMASGIPVVSSGKGSLKEVGGTAAITPAGDDPESYADALRTVLEAGSVRETVISRGQEWARRFSWEKAAEQTARTYHKVWEASRFGEVGRLAIGGAG